MNIISKIKDWLFSIAPKRPDDIIEMETNFNGKIEKSTITAEQADDLSEAFFKERWFGTINNKEEKKSK